MVNRTKKILAKYNFASCSASPIFQESTTVNHRYDRRFYFSCLVDLTNDLVYEDINAYVSGNEVTIKPLLGDPHPHNFAGGPTIRTARKRLEDAIKEILHEEGFL